MKPNVNVIAVDFDGTVVRHAYPEIGGDVGAVPVLRRMVSAGYKLILFTMRSGRELQDAVDWCAKHEIPLHGINENPGQKSWTSSPKAYAQLYIDDAALGAPLIHPKDGSRPFIDWIKVETMIFGDSYIGEIREGLLHILGKYIWEKNTPYVRYNLVDELRSEVRHINAEMNVREVDPEKIGLDGDLSSEIIINDYTRNLLRQNMM